MDLLLESLDKFRKIIGLGMFYIGLCKSFVGFLDRLLLAVLTTMARKHYIVVAG